MSKENKYKTLNLKKRKSRKGKCQSAA